MFLLCGVLSHLCPLRNCRYIDFLFSSFIVASLSSLSSRLASRHFTPPTYFPFIPPFLSFLLLRFVTLLSIHSPSPGTEFFSIIALPLERSFLNESSAHGVLVHFIRFWCVEPTRTVDAHRDKPWTDATFFFSLFAGRSQADPRWAQSQIWHRPQQCESANEEHVCVTVFECVCVSHLLLSESFWDALLEANPLDSKLSSKFNFENVCHRNQINVKFQQQRWLLLPLTSVFLFSLAADEWLMRLRWIVMRILFKEGTDLLLHHEGRVIISCSFRLISPRVH